MIADRRTSVAFTGHRTYRGAAADALRRTVGELYARGFRTFLSGMAVGFDLAAAEAEIFSECHLFHPFVLLRKVKKSTFFSLPKFSRRLSKNICADGTP